jgi:NADP-dependent 3-hydroxy acid dehydrogenase YdfG
MTTSGLKDRVVIVTGAAAGIGRATSSASFITGAVLSIDGGLVIGT